eukprot:6211760-Pleurochrysis_carterae.AAC.3
MRVCACTLRRTPWFLRVAIHEIVDEVWGGVQVEVERIFEKLLDKDRKTKDENDEDDEGSERETDLVSPPPSPPSSPLCNVLHPNSALRLPLAHAPEESLRHLLNDAALTNASRSAASRPASHLTLFVPSLFEPSLLECARGASALGAHARGVSPPPSPPPEDEDADQAVYNERGTHASSVTSEEAKEPNIAITVRLIRARGLTAADKNGYSDPYAKLSIGKQKKTSRVVNKNINPEWDQTFEFHGLMPASLDETLFLEVGHVTCNAQKPLTSLQRLCLVRVAC